MSNLTQRGPNANASARLPALQAARAQDPNVQKSLEAIREWIEVRLGARGDRFERAVTFRDLVQELDALERRLASAASSDSSPTTDGGSGVTSADLDAIEAALTVLRVSFSNLDGSVTSRVASLTTLVATKGDFFSNTSTSVDGEVVLFSGTAGKTGKRATGSGYAKLASGVLSADTMATVRTDL